MIKSLVRKLGVSILAFGVIVSYSSISYGWSHNEHQINTTGAPAYDVVKILDGDYEITEMMEWDFKNHEYYHRLVDGNMQTVLRWWGDGNQQVPNGTAGDVCFTAVPLSGSASYAKIIGAWWTDEHGVPMGNYYPAVTATVNFKPMEDGKFIPVVNLGNFQAAQIEVKAEDPEFWKNGNFKLIGEAAPLPIQAVKVAIVNKALTPRTLNLQNTLQGPLADQFFDVFGPADGTAGRPLVLPYGEVLSASLADIGANNIIAVGQSLVMVVDMGNGNYDFFNFEAPIPSPCGETDLGIIDIKDAKQRLGGEVTIPVRVQGALNRVFSAGVDLYYDPYVLNFLDSEPGPLSQTFEMLKVADLGGGHLRIGGTDTAGSIDVFSAGDLVLLHFLVIGGVENESYPLKLDLLVDDIATWPASGGCLTIIPACNGDLNGDNMITPADALIALKSYLMGTLVPCSDVNMDGKVTPADALCILQKYLGQPSCLN